MNNANIGEYIDLEGIRMHYIEKGAFPSCWSTGVGQSLYTWRNNIELSEHFHVYAPDLLGHGYSDKPDIEYTISDHANMILAFMDALRIERAHIIGFGTGGTFALDFMIRNPEQAEKAVIISPGGMTRTTRSMCACWAVLFREGLYRHAEPVHGSQAARTYFDQTGVEDKIVEEYTRPLMSGEAKSVILRCIGAYDDAGVLENLRLVEHPCSCSGARTTSGTS